MLKNLINRSFLSYNLKRNSVFLLLFGLLFFTTFPLPILIMKLNDPTNKNPFAQYVFRYPSYGYIIAMVSMGLVLSVLVMFVIFNYLTSKKSVDVFHALPLKRKELFLTHVLTGNILILLPFTINYFLGHAMLYGFYNVTFGRMFEIYLIISIFFVIIQSIPTFVIMNTGTLIDSMIHTGLFILIPFFIYFVIAMFTSEFLFGLDQISPTILKGMTPFYAVYHAVNLETFPTQLVIYWVVIYLLIISAQVILYKNRKSERSEEPFTNRFYFPIVASIFTGIFFVIINVVYRAFDFEYAGLSGKDFFTIESFLLALILSFVAYAILSLFKNRSTKGFLKIVRNFVVITVVASLFSYSIIQTQAFGTVWNLPNSKNIDYIIIDDYQLSSIDPILSANEFSYHYNSVKIIDDTLISEFVKIHNSINQKVKKEKNFLKNGDFSGFNSDLYPNRMNTELANLSFTYVLENNREMNYSLNVPISLLMDFTVLLKSSQYQKMINPILDSSIPMNHLTISNDVMDSVIQVPNNSHEAVRFEFIENYLKDIEAIRQESMVHEPAQLKYIVDYEFTIQFKTDYEVVRIDGYAYDTTKTMSSGSKVFIDDRFVNTVNYLDSIYVNPIKNDSHNYVIEEVNNSHVSNFGQIFNAGGYYNEGKYDYEYEGLESLTEAELDALRENLLGSHVNSDGRRYNYLIINGNTRLPIK